MKLVFTAALTALVLTASFAVQARSTGAIKATATASLAADSNIITIGKKGADVRKSASSIKYRRSL